MADPFSLHHEDVPPPGPYAVSLPGTIQVRMAGENTKIRTRQSIERMMGVYWCLIRSGEKRDIERGKKNKPVKN